MGVKRNPVAFFAAHAARRLVDGRHADDWSAAGAVFNDAYPYAMPMAEYAHRTLAQARRAHGQQAKRILEALARYRIVDAVIDGALGDATYDERTALSKARAAARRRAPARERPLARRPAVGAVVLAREGAQPFTIANVRWAGDDVEQRWMHEHRLEALVRRLVAAPPSAPYVLAVAGRTHFSPARLAFSTPDRLAVCHPERTERVDTARLRRLERCFAGREPERRALFEFRALCRSRALVADTVGIDRALLRIAGRWGRDANALHALLLPATDIELAVLGAANRD